MALVELRDVTVPTDAACTALGVSRASLYRTRKPSPPRAPAASRAPNPRRLDDDERQHLLDMFHSPEFADQPPTEVYAALLGRGIYLASIRTLYRIPSAKGLPAGLPRNCWSWQGATGRCRVPRRGSIA